MAINYDYKIERLAKIKKLLADRQPDLTVFMDEVHKPQNLAAVMRTADAVGIGKVHAVWPKKNIKQHHHTSGGSSRWVEVEVHQDRQQAIATLKSQGMQVLAAHLSGSAVDFREVDYTKPTAILLGQEKHGVTEDGAELADQHIIIPMMGMVQSLNVSVANAVILYEAQRQRQLAGMYGDMKISQSEADKIIFERLHPRVTEFCQKHDLRYPLLDGEGDIDDPEWYELRKKV